MHLNPNVIYKYEYPRENNQDISRVTDFTIIIEGAIS